MKGRIYIGIALILFTVYLVYINRKLLGLVKDDSQAPIKEEDSITEERTTGRLSVTAVPNIRAYWDKYGCKGTIVSPNGYADPKDDPESYCSGEIVEKA